MNFVGIYNGYTIYEDGDNYVCIENGKTFLTEVQAFKACMNGEIEVC